MNEHQKDLLLFTLFPFLMLLLGLSLLWMILGSAAFTLLHSMIAHFYLLWAILGFVGILGVLYELRVALKFVGESHFVAEVSLPRLCAVGNRGYRGFSDGLLTYGKQ